MNSFLLSELEACICFDDIPGAGTPLVFIHGLGCASSTDYPSITGNPRVAGHRRILVDLLGSGFSDKPEEFSYDIRAHADTVCRLLSSLGISQAYVFGHSMGGSIAVTMAVIRPELVSGLILAEPNLDPGGGIYSRQIAGQGESDYVAEGHAKMMGQARAGGNKVWADSLARSSAVAVYRAARSLVQGTAPTWRMRLSAMKIPRTVIFGERSLPHKDTETLPLSGIRVAIVSDAGHWMSRENPAGLANAIADSLD